jgi:hypothetical protein
LSCLVILTLTWLGGKWLNYSLSDYFIGFLRLSGNTLARPVMVYLGGKNKPATGISSTSSAQPQTNPTPIPPQAQYTHTTRRHTFSILRGLLLALPIVAVLAALLASADPIFSNRLNDILQIFRLEKLGEYIFRGIYILVGTYLLIGVYLHAMGPSREEKLIGLEKPWLAPFLGWTEAVVVLVCVDLLFASFVIIQFAYFFGGQANITVEGFTYAEYARRGFTELVMVSVISLMLFLGLSMITRRQGSIQRRVFTGLGIGLVILVGVILVSAYQRLLLYEAAYSFTTIRTFTHVFMIWLGMLLLSTVVLELMNQLRAFALAFVLTCLGFGISINVLNVDRFIVNQNAARAVQGADLDTAYLVNLSDDAVPALFERFDDSRTPQPIKEKIGGILACRAAIRSDRKVDTSWPSFHLSSYTAQQLFTQRKIDLNTFPVTHDSNGLWQVKVAGVETECQGYRSMD